MEYRHYKEFFRALGNPTRFRIVRLLRDRSHNVGQIAEALGYEQSRVSHSLACLLNCGFVVWRWEGKNKIYQLNPKIAPILAAMDKHLEAYAPQLDSCQVLGEESPKARPVVLIAANSNSARQPRRRRRRST